VGIHVDAASGGFIAPFQVALLLLLGSGGGEIWRISPQKNTKKQNGKSF